MQQFTASRLKIFIRILICAAVIAVGWYLTTQPAMRRHSEVEIHIAGWIIVLIAALNLIFYTAAILSPPKLSIDCQGFTIFWPLLKRRECHWAEIIDINVERRAFLSCLRWKYDQSEVPAGRIKLDGRLPAIWAEPLTEVLSAMVRIRARRG